MQCLVAADGKVEKGKEDAAVVSLQSLLFVVPHAQRVLLAVAFLTPRHAYKQLV